jgi:Short C-terminal domain
MGQARKAGMWCENEGKPVAAVKTTHGIRNALAIPTLGLTAKVEGWMCPDCGGPVTKNRRLPQADRLKLEEKARASFENRRNVVAIVPAAVLTALRETRTKELKDSFGLNKSEVSTARNLLVGDWRSGSDDVKPDVPTVIASGIAEDTANKFKLIMEKLGAQAELVAAEYQTSEPLPGAASESPPGPVSSPEASGDVLAQIEKLGQLRDTGILTDEEFDAKKAELLGRL